MKDQRKVSAAVAVAVTVLALAVAISFSVTSIAYQKEVMELKRINTESRKIIQSYQGVLLGIKNQLSRVDIRIP